MQSPQEDFHNAWVAELDRLELDLQVAERMLHSNQVEPLPTWTEPTMHGPMPEDLLPRARLILEQQLAVAHALTQKASSSAQQLQLTERLRGSMRPDIPVYVDLQA